MKRAGKAAFVWSVTSVLAAILAASCRDPTEVTVSISTTESCGNFQGVAITVGPDTTTTEANFEDHFVNATSTACDATSGLVGTLVLTPGNTTGSILVAGGVRKPDGTLQDPSLCGGGGLVAGAGGTSTDANSAYCIIARRTFAFAEHTPLTLPITLDTSCIGRDCNPGSTCYQGACVSDNVVCSGSACGLTQEIGQNPDENDASSGSVDGSGNPPPGSGDASIDGGLDSGTSSIVDASSDGSVDSGTGIDGGYTLSDGGTGAGSVAPCETPFFNGTTYQATCSLDGTHGQICTDIAFQPDCCTCACIVGAKLDDYVICSAMTAGGSCMGFCNNSSPGGGPAKMRK